MDQESGGKTILPANFLRQLIAMYGDSMQGLVPQYLEASMEAFQRNQSQFRDAMTGAFANPFTEIAKRNMEMFAAATGAKPGNAAEPEPDTKAELAELKEQMAALQRKLDRSEEHTSELQSLMRISYAVFCLKKNKNKRI